MGDCDHPIMLPSPRLLIFSDLDGCLLNKHDYDWRDAEYCLLRLRQGGIPVILCSSKTLAEMEVLAESLPILPASLIAENGGSIRFRSIDSDEVEDLQPGGHRHRILDLLSELKSQFQFRSFRDLGLAGVMQATDLDETAAVAAMQRHSTEPLLWDDTAEHREQFSRRLHEHGFTLTKGGRFWHVAGQTSKGQALEQVAARLGNRPQQLIAAIGDSQIDQSMLDVADVPIGIRVNGRLGVQIDPTTGIIPESEGAAGWAEAVTALLDRIA